MGILADILMKTHFRNIIQKLFFSCLLCTTGYAGKAQVSWQLRASSNVVSMQEQLQITYSLQAAIAEDFRTPQFSDWEVLSGPISTATTTIDRNGKTMLQEFSFILTPKHTGKCNVPLARISVNNKVYESNKLVIEVLAAKPAEKATPVSNSNGFTYDAFVLDSKENAEEKIAKNLFLEIKLNKNKCYEGETIVAEYLLYSRVNLTAKLDKRPGFNGFSSIDLPSDVTSGEYRFASKSGKVYKVYNLRKVQLTPLQHGELSIDPLELSATVSFLRLKEGQSLSTIDPYFPDKTIDVPYQLTATPTKVFVSPLPEANKPADGYSPVGRFTMKITGPTKEIGAGETGNIDITIEGMGQWNMMKAPEIQWPAGVTGFEPRIDERLDSQAVPVKGTRSFQYRFVADSAGSFPISVKGFTYFDPWQQAYKSCSDTSISIVVKAVAVQMISADDDPYSSTGHSTLTDLFTRFMPMVALGLALLIAVITAIFLQTKKGKADKEFTSTRQHHMLDEPEQSVTVAASKKSAIQKEDAPVQAPVKSNTFYEPDIRTLAKEYKAQASALLQQHPANSEAIIVFMQTCDEIMYAPLVTDFGPEALHEMYFALQSS